MSGSYRTTALLALLATSLLLSGCASHRPAALRTNFVEFNEQQRAEYEAAEPGEYRIQEGDRLSLVFTYLEEKDLRGITVLPDGAVTLPAVDRIMVAGRTISEADSVITEAYSTIYRNPDLSLLIEETVGRQVYVLGEVMHPGLHPVPQGGIGILNAIGAAGGFTEDAKKSNTVLVRMDENGYLCQEIDLSDFHTVAGVAYTGVALESYDVIYVPRSRVGDFGYFSSTVLAGILNITRIVSDVRYIDSGVYKR